jgi:disulfide bond formation protein DsbB
MFFDLMGLTPTVVDTLATLTILMQIVAIILIVMILCAVFTKKPCGRILQWIVRHAILLTFIVSLTSISGSLFFSEIALWAPCRLCWIQRIFMYPQVVLLGIALWYRDRGVFRYILILCIIGIAVSAFHYAEQVQSMLNPDAFDPSVPCDLSGISCRATYMLEYGYVTIPLMAGTAFLLNMIGSLTAIFCQKK